MVLVCLVVERTPRFVQQAGAIAAAKMILTENTFSGQHPRQIIDMVSIQLYQIACQRRASMRRLMIQPKPWIQPHGFNRMLNFAMQ